MKRLPLAAGVVLSLAVAPHPARAQGEDARVLPRGWVELRGVGIYTQYRERFVDGGSQPLGAPFGTAVQALTERLLEPVVPPLQTGLAAFFAGTQGQVQNPVTPAAVTGGDARVQIAADHRDVPFTLSYGLTRRITLGVTVPLVRRGTPVQALFLGGGSVGLNPDTLENGALLEGIDPAYRALGRSRFLPVAGTPAAIELQRRVFALAEDSLELPEVPLEFADLLVRRGAEGLFTTEDSLALLTPPFRSRFQLGDVEVGARVQLTGPVPSWPFSPDSALPSGVRTTVGVSVRLPTGARSSLPGLLAIPPGGGHFGVGVDVLNDVFLSRKWWLTASGSYRMAFAADVERRAFAEDRPFPDSLVTRTLRREPGARLAVTLTPRYRLTREISFAAQYAFSREGKTTFSASDTLGAVLLGFIETADAWTAHRVGLGASYSTIESFYRGRTPVPLEVYLLYRNVVAGSGGAPRAGSIEVSGRVPYQLIGRPRRERPDTTRADSAAARVPPPPAPPPLERPPVPLPQPVPAPAPAPAPAPPPPPQALTRRP